MDIDKDEWKAGFEFNIDDVRLLKGVIEYALQTWPGAPARPYQEQEFLMHMKSVMFALVTEYNFTYNEHQ